MRQIPLALAIGALALTAAAFALDALDFAADGLVVNDVEPFPGVTLAEQNIAVVLLWATALSLLVVILAIIWAIRRRQRAWIMVLLLLLPVGYYGWFGLLTFDGGIGLAAVGLVPALVTTAYFVWTSRLDRPTVTSP